MQDNTAYLFNEHDTKTETVTLRLTKDQKCRVSSMAAGRSVSAYILNLIAQENQRLIDSKFMSFIGYDSDDTSDDLPF